MADARKGGGTKWKGLVLFMDEHKLHGIAPQELRLSDQTTFMSNKHTYNGLTLLMHPCIEEALNGAAGGLVKSYTRIREEKAQIYKVAIKQLSSLWHHQCGERGNEGHIQSLILDFYC